MKRVMLVAFLLMILISACGPSTPTTRPIAEVSVYTVEPAEVVIPTEAPAEPTEPPPTKIPTETPIPPTATPEPEPIIFEGTGDTVLDVDKPDVPMLVHVTGNECSGHFAVIPYDIDRNSSLVNTTDLYNGVVPLDFGGEWTKRFEVLSSCDWKIEILPLSTARLLDVPGTIEGTGDEVFLLTGETPDVAYISGNACSGHFAVIPYDINRQSSLVNTTDPYEGIVLVDADARVLEVMSTCSWTIEISTK